MWLLTVSAGLAIDIVYVYGLPAYCICLLSSSYQSNSVKVLVLGIDMYKHNKEVIRNNNLCKKINRVNEFVDQICFYYEVELEI